MSFIGLKSSAWIGLARLFCFAVLLHQDLRAETLIAPQSEWKWIKGTQPASSPVDAWRLSNFSDTTWPSGGAPFYYDNNGEITGSTLLSDMRGNYNSIYLRKTFSVSDLSQVSALVLNVEIDDGYVIWINGKEFHRYNVAEGELAHNQFTPLAIEPTQINFQSFDPDAFLVVGQNICAVHVFNRNLTSSDFVFDMSLETEVSETDPPFLTEIRPAPESRVDQFTSITFVFSEPIKGLGADDLLIQGVPAEMLVASGNEYTFSFEPPSYGMVRVEWSTDIQVTDFAQPPNAFVPTPPWTYDFRDTQPPTLLTITPRPGTTQKSLSQIQLIFSEPVTGFSEEDLLLNGQPPLELLGDGSGPYLITFTPPPAGSADLTWTASPGIVDLAMPPNAFVPNSWSYSIDPNLVSPSLEIHEILASNRSETSGLKDEDGELQDWIELRNGGEGSVDLAGWTLTDDPDDPGRWPLPSITLAPGQYLVIFASGKNRSNTQVGVFHANFLLNTKGEFLGLYNAEFPQQPISLLDPAYPEQRSDHSYGRDSEGQWKYFQTPTPGQPNTGQTLTQLLSPPHFSVTRGQFLQAFDLLLHSKEPGAAIRYTLDGSEPTATHGNLYSNPISIARTTVVRALTVKSGCLPSSASTHTYLFPDQIVEQSNQPAGFPSSWGNDGNFPLGRIPADYEMDPELTQDPAKKSLIRNGLLSLPSVALTMNQADLFNPSTGIYANPEPPSQQRPLWERPCSLEMILENGETAFQIDAGIRISGNASRTPRKTPKHSFRLFFRGDYGARDLNYPVFPDSPATQFDTLVMRGGFNYSWLHWSPDQRSGGSLIRDAWTKATWREMGHPGSHSRLFHLYINGVYWGIYDFGERIDARFAEQYLGGEAENFDAIASKPTRATNGDITTYNTLLSRVNTLNLSQYSQYRQVDDLLDVPNHVDYLLLNFFGANRDWGLDSNWNALRPRTPGGKLQYFVWDAEQLLVGVNDNRVNNSDVPSGLHTSLLQSPEYRLTWADRIYRHLFQDGALTLDQNVERWQEWANTIDLAMWAEAARWGDYRRDVHSYQNGPYALYSVDSHWQPESNRLLRSYFPQRNAIFLQQLRTAELYPNLNPPEATPSGGHFVETLSVTLQGSGELYYTLDGSDPREPGSSLPSATAIRYQNPFTLDHSVILKARAKSGTTWSALNERVFEHETLRPAIHFSEMMHSPQGGSTYEFIELINTGTIPLDLAGFSFEGIDYLFPANSWIQPGERFVLASNDLPAVWSIRYPEVTPKGYFGGRLDGQGERLALLDGSGNLVESVRYRDAYPWPQPSGDTTASLERVSFQGDPNDPFQWDISTGPDGTPGDSPIMGNSSLVRLNEVYAASNPSQVEPDLQNDWIELRNTGETSVDLSGWILRDSSPDHVFTFPPNTQIQAQELLRIDFDSNTLSPGLHTGFALDRQGDLVSLFNALGQRIDGVVFGNQITANSLSLLEGIWKPGIPTPNEENQGATQAPPSSLKINEWMSNSLPGQPDWVELINLHATLPLDLNEFFLGHSQQYYSLGIPIFLEPNGYLVLNAGGNSDPGELPFKLNASADRLELRDPLGNILQTLQIPPATENISQGFLMGNFQTIQTLNRGGTPGSANLQINPLAVHLNEVLVRDGNEENSPGNPGAGFVEVINSSNDDLSLDGLRLSWDGLSKTTWPFPSGMVLPSQASLAIWFTADAAPSTTADSPLFSGFALDPEGGLLTLHTSEDLQLDFVTFGHQVDGYSIGRDSSGAWHLLASPTPGATNTPAASLGALADVSINEWMSNPLQGDDWVELFSQSETPVDLSGCILSDNPSISGFLTAPIAPLTYLGSFQHALWYAVGNSSSKPAELEFALDSQGEILRLYSPDFLLLDSVNIVPSDSGVSRGRFPDGTSQIQFFPDSPTPGLANSLTPVGDRDQDGMPDEWEIRFGLDPMNPDDSQEDLDQDGFTNRMEFLAGTLPNDSSDYFSMDLFKVNNTWILGFNAVEGRTYQLWSSEQLETGSWTNEPLHQAKVTERVELQWQPPLSGSSRFLRIQVLYLE